MRITQLLGVFVLLAATAAPGWGQFIRLPAIRPPAPHVPHVPHVHVGHGPAAGHGSGGSGLGAPLDTSMPFGLIMMGLLAGAFKGTFSFARTFAFASRTDLMARGDFIGAGSPAGARFVCLVFLAMMLGVDVFLGFVVVQFILAAPAEAVIAALILAALVGGVLLALRAWRAMTVRHIRILDTPPGEAPEYIRQAWVGIVLPLARRDRKARMHAVSGVVSGLQGDAYGYAIDGLKAMKCLETHAPHAADWWRRNVPLTHAAGAQLIFPMRVCELIAPSRPLASLWRRLGGRKQSASAPEPKSNIPADWATRWVGLGTDGRDGAWIPGGKPPDWPARKPPPDGRIL